jgi:hypothetical protein
MNLVRVLHRRPEYLVPTRPSGEIHYQNKVFS